MSASSPSDTGDDMISVVGYGSLLSEESARASAPGLRDFHLVTVHGYMRLFNKVGIVFIEKYGARPDDLAVASCATRPNGNYSIICSVFRCGEKEFPALYEREHRYQWISVPFENSDGTFGHGRMCTESSDVHYRLNKCVTPSEYFRRVGQFYPGKIWRDDILPFPRFLELCLRAAAGHGPDVLDNFLDTSFLADGKTSIRKYMASDPVRSALIAGILPARRDSELTGMSSNPKTARRL